MKKLLILGGTGFIGSKVVEHLHNKYKLVVFYKNKIPDKLKEYGVTFVKGDVLDLKSLSKCFSKDIYAVINLVGQIMPDEALFKKTNIIGNKNVIDLIKKYNIKRTILVSSALVYGESKGIASKESRLKNPKTLYAKIKSEVEEMYLNEINNLIILRIGNVYGKDQGKGIIHNLITAYKKNSVFRIPYKNKVRTFINVCDVAIAVELVLNKRKTNNTIYNIGNEKKSISEVVSLFEKIANCKFEKIKVKVDNEDEVFIDNILVRQELLFKPKIKLEEGIMEVLKHEGIV